jgi:hypothetical protein
MWQTARTPQRDEEVLSAIFAEHGADTSEWAIFSRAR